MSKRPEIRAREQIYREVNRDRINQRAAEHRKNNKPAYAVTATKWRKLHPESTRAQNSRRRAKKRGAEGSFTADDIAAIRRRQHDQCLICRVNLNGKGTVDHIVPLAAGGSNWPSNLQLLCKPCNSSKGARDPIEFLQSRGILI
jgi:5-methylcytosine-specific restriction endonuclease McrA